MSFSVSVVSLFSFQSSQLAVNPRADHHDVVSYLGTISVIGGASSLVAASAPLTVPRGV